MRTIFLFLLCSVTAFASTTEEIKRIVTDAKEAYGLQAVLVSVWRGEEELFTQALGNSMTDVPATEIMHFRVGAVTISYLGTLLLMLADQGKVSLDDPLSRWFPHYPHSEEITLRMLANSSSGYQDYVYSEEFQKAFPKSIFDDFPVQQFIDLMVSKPLAFQPGKGWGYSHTNFVILGQVLEKITGQPLAQALKPIYAKLGLLDTAFPATPQIQEPVLHAFTSWRGLYEESTYWNPSWTSFSGRMTSNLIDLVTWTKALGSGKLISQHAFEEMVAPVTANLGESSPDHYYGIGVICADHWILQNARFGGYNVTIAYLPEQQIALCVSTTLGEKSSLDLSHSKLILKEIAKYLAPDRLLPKKA